MSDATGSDTSTGAWVVEESEFDRERANYYETVSPSATGGSVPGEASRKATGGSCPAPF